MKFPLLDTCFQQTGADRAGGPKIR
jgi:hypothetical protein